MLEQYMPDEVQGAIGSFNRCADSSIRMFSQYLMMKKRGERVDDTLQKMLQKYNAEHPIIFNGSLSDMKWFWTNENLSLKQIESIPSDEVRKTVLSGLQRRCQEGLLQYNDKIGSWCLTEQGKKTIFDQNFIGMIFKTDAEIYNNIAENIKQQQLATNKQSEFAGDADINVNSSEVNKQIEFAGDKDIKLQSVDKLMYQAQEQAKETGSTKYLIGEKYVLQADKTDFTLYLKDNIKVLHTTKNAVDSISADYITDDILKFLKSDKNFVVSNIKPAVSNTVVKTGKAVADVSAKAALGASTAGISTAVEIAYKVGDALIQPIKQSVGISRKGGK